MFVLLAESVFVLCVVSVCAGDGVSFVLRMEPWFEFWVQSVFILSVDSMFVVWGQSAFVMWIESVFVLWVESVVGL